MNKSRAPSPGYIYVVALADGTIKVGRSRNAARVEAEAHKRMRAATLNRRKHVAPQGTERAWWNP